MSDNRPQEPAGREIATICRNVANFLRIEGEPSFGVSSDEIASRNETSAILRAHADALTALAKAVDGCKKKSRDKVGYLFICGDGGESCPDCQDKQLAAIRTLLGKTE